MFNEDKTDCKSVCMEKAILLCWLCGPSKLAHVLARNELNHLRDDVLQRICRLVQVLQELLLQGWGWANGGVHPRPGSRMTGVSATLLKGALHGALPMLTCAGRSPSTMSVTLLMQNTGQPKRSALQATAAASISCSAAPGCVNGMAAGKMQRWRRQHNFLPAHSAHRPPSLLHMWARGLPCSQPHLDRRLVLHHARHVLRCVVQGVAAGHHACGQQGGSSPRWANQDLDRWGASSGGRQKGNGTESPLTVQQWLHAPRT